MAWTTPGTATAGNVLTASFWNTQVRDQFTEFSSQFAGMTSYTPALTASITNPTLGTGSSITGTYAKMGRLAIVYFSITFGTSGTNAGSGNYWVSLPSATPWSGNIIVAGTGYMTDASDTSRRYLVTFERADTTKFLLIYPGTSFGVVSANAPFAFAASDALTGSLVFWCDS